MRCEGYRRYGGIMRLGPARWEQCKEEAIVTLRLDQGDGEQVFPACTTCWKEARDTKGVEVIEAEPLALAEDAPNAE